jgi:hypothetical protein
VHLPNGEDYASRDDVRLSVAFGFVAHLCELIAFVVNVPLRHPVEFKGSRSSVISHLAPGMAGVGPITVTDQPLVQIPLSFHFALTFFFCQNFPWICLPHINTLSANRLVSVIPKVFFWIIRTADSRCTNARRTGPSSTTLLI